MKPGEVHKSPLNPGRFTTSSVPVEGADCGLTTYAVPVDGGVVEVRTYFCLANDTTYLLWFTYAQTTQEIAGVNAAFESFSIAD